MLKKRCCKSCGDTELLQGLLCKNCYNDKQRQIYKKRTKAKKTDWEYFCDTYPDEEFRLAKYNDFMDKKQKYQNTLK